MGATATLAQHIVYGCSLQSDVTRATLLLRQLLIETEAFRDTENIPMKASLVSLAFSASRRLVFVSSISLVVILAACGAKEKSASQVAAKVNKEEISVHQINFVLQKQQGIRPEDADAAAKVILERLIDQELAVQKAGDLKLDREPQTVQALEAAKREVLARAYQDRLTESVAKPTDDELSSYFSSKPALFKERRIYQLDELNVEVPPEKIVATRNTIAALKSLGEVTSFLKSEGLGFSESQAVRSAEQLPLSAVETFSKLADGQNIVSAKPGGLQVVVVVSSRFQPVTFEEAKPAIEQYLVNARKKELVEKAVKDLRSSSKIEYVGAFANGGGASAVENSASAAVPVIASTPPAASASLDASTINKGMGIK